MPVIKKAVIPAAGLGTRMLPATKASPKEMLPIVDKPAIQYIVEEAVASGIEDILIIVSRGKTILEDHFDRSPELEERLITGKKEKELSECLKIANMANISYIRQKEIKGLGHAVYHAKSFTGSEPFAVLYGDDVVMGTPATLELARVYEEFGLGVAGVKEVTRAEIMKYCTLDVQNIRDNIYKVFDMVEKPSEDKIMSLFSILGRVILPSGIYGILENTVPGAGGEIQLTDAMKTLTKTAGMNAVEYTGKRYDMGNKLGVMQAQVETALKHEEIGEKFREYLKGLVGTL